MNEKNLLDTLKIGYFILYKSNGKFFARSIEQKQLWSGLSLDHARFTHVEISGGGEHSVNISPPLSKSIDITKRHKGRYIRIMRYKNADYEKKGRYKVAYFAATLCNKRYDFRGILAFICKWIKQNNRLFFCSEGCAWALQKEFPEAGGGKPSCKWMPAHFCGEEFEKVWEGIIP